MKVQETKTRLHKSQDFEESSFGIRSQSDLVHIFDVLRNKLYTNKVLAVIREYSTNAQDSHVQSNNPDRPIEVSLPTSWDLNFSIRDFGPGLNDAEIREVYVMYGASTKRESNAFNGQLGFGCKAGFSYGDSYQVTSYQNGTAKHYECFIDPSKVGKIALLSSSPSNEEDGIKITIPVKTSDVNVFQSTAHLFYQHFRPRPNFINLHAGISEDEVIASGDEWQLLGHGHRSGALMGNVFYPIDYKILIAEVPSNVAEKVRILSGIPIKYTFDIGELSIAASREGLEYDKPTIRHICNKIKKTYLDLQKIIETRLASASTIIEARALYADLFSYSGELRHLSCLIKPGGITWNGKKIDNYAFQYKFSEEILGIQVTRAVGKKYGITKNTFGDKSFSYSNNLVWSIRDAESFKLVYCDNQHKWVQRVAKLLSNDPKIQTILVIKTDEKDLLQDFLDKTCLSRNDLIDVSTLDALPTATVPRTPYPTSDLHLRKHKSKVFTLNLNGPKYPNAASDSWSISDVDISKKGGTYLQLDRFNTKLNKSPISPFSLLQLFQDIKSLSGKDYAKNFFGIKKKLVPKLNKKLWVDLNDVIGKGASACLTPDLIEELIQRKMISMISNYSSDKKVIAKTLSKIDYNYWDEDNEIHQKIKLVVGWHRGKISHKFDKLDSLHRIFYRFPEIQELANKELDLAISKYNRIFEDIHSEYPMLSLLNYQQFDTEMPKKVMNYIDLVDSNKKTRKRNNNDDSASNYY